MMIAAIYVRIVMLAVLGLLALATSVSAECAWVLWEGVWTDRQTPHDQSWAVISAWPKNADCRPVVYRAAEDRARRFGPSNDSTKVTLEGNQASVISATGSLHYTYVCLPDTVDPRGSKGK